MSGPSIELYKWNQSHPHPQSLVFGEKKRRRSLQMTSSWSFSAAILNLVLGLVLHLHHRPEIGTLAKIVAAHHRFLQFSSIYLNPKRQAKVKTEDTGAEAEAALVLEVDMGAGKFRRRLSLRKERVKKWSMISWQHFRRFMRALM